MLAAARGYRCVLVMPSATMGDACCSSPSAELVLTEALAGMAGAVAKAESIVDMTPGAFMPAYVENLHNPEAHTLTTARGRAGHRGCSDTW